MGALFLIVSFAYNHLVQPQHIHWFQTLYYLSSFFGLFGSHTTSFLLSGALASPSGTPFFVIIAATVRVACGACRCCVQIASSWPACLSWSTAGKYYRNCWSAPDDVRLCMSEWLTPDQTYEATLPVTRVTYKSVTPCFQAHVGTIIRHL